MNKRTDGRTNLSPFYRTSSPTGTAAQKQNPYKNPLCGRCPKTGYQQTLPLIEMRHSSYNARAHVRMCEQSRKYMYSHAILQHSTIIYSIVCRYSTIQHNGSDNFSTFIYSVLFPLFVRKETISSRLWIRRADLRCGRKG